MPESFVPILLDECTTPPLADLLRGLGYDAVHINELHRRSLSDPDQIAFATEHGRAILTYNLAEFSEIHARMMADGLEHAGIIVSEDYNRRMGAFVRDLPYTLDDMARRHGGGTEWIRNQLVFIRKAPS